MAAVDGPAFGADFVLQLACDVVLANDRARFRPVFSWRGIMADRGALFVLPRFRRAASGQRVMLSGRVVEAAEALQIGLCTEMLPAVGFAAAARACAAAEPASGPTLALGAAKVVMNKGLESDLWSVQMFERFIQPRLVSSDDFVEGFAAFRERRPPRFEGR